MATKITGVLFFCFLVLQLLLWNAVKVYKPDFGIVPPLPSETEVKALSFGDDQFYFRLLAMQIQNAGDSFGRSTPLKDYDYGKLENWFHLLDVLDPISNFVPALASYYYSNTQHKPDVRYVVRYLEKHADKDPKKKWWWYAQAVSNANYKLKDKKLALRIARKLARVENDAMPIWTRQMPAFILDDIGEKQQAIIIIEQLMKDHEARGISAGELNFMSHYITEQLEAIKAEVDGATPEKKGAE